MGFLQGAIQKAFTGSVGARLLPGGVGEPPKRGTAEMLAAYNTMPWLRAVVNKVSRSVASSSWELYIVQQNGRAVHNRKAQFGDFATRKAAMKSAGANTIENHPFLDLMENPNPFFVGIAARQLVQIYLDLVGEAFLLKERNGAGMPIALWPIPPTWVEATPTPGNPFFRLNAPNRVEIPETEIVWISEPDPANPYGRGSSTAGALSDELETDEFAAKHVKSWFYNRARPDLLISGDNLSPAETARLEADWLKKNQGFWKAFKPYFLSRKVDVQSFSQTLESMQFVELRKHERNTIIQVYGVPPEVLGVIESSNRATIEASEYLFGKWVLEPRLEFSRAVLQQRLIPDFDSRLILGYNNPIQEDKEHYLKVAKSAPWAMMVDEWREMQGLPPLPGDQGKIYLVPTNMVAVSSLLDAKVAELPEPAPAAKSIEPIMVRDIPIRDKVRTLVNAVTVDALEAQMVPVIQETMAAHGKAALVVLGKNEAFDLLNPAVIHYILSDARHYMRLITRTTRNALQKELEAGLAAGESTPKLAERVSRVFSTAKEHRARVIAQTETTRAANYGYWQGMRQGGVREKEWVSIQDVDTREDHMLLDGMRQPIDKPFVTAHGNALYPGGFGDVGNDVHCRCTIAPVVDGVTLFATEGERSEAWRKFAEDLRGHRRRMRSAAIKGLQAQQNAVMDVLKAMG